MKINNKGFTFVEILAVIVIIGLLTGISIAAFSRYKENAIKGDYEALARSSYNAMEEYMMSHPYDDTVSLETLEEENLLSNRKDPASKDTDCTGTVEVSKNSGSNGKLDDGTYKVNLCCVSIQKTYTYPGGKETNLTDSSKCEYVPEDIPTPPPTPGTKYTLKYNDNGGSGCSSKSITKNAGEAWGSLCTPTRSGYTFKGWKSGTETITSSSIANGNKTVVAQWSSTSSTKYTLKYNDNNGSGCSTKTITRNKNEAWGSLCTPKRTGYTFNGWYDGSTKYTSTTKATKNVTVKAKWTPKKYTITVKKDGNINLLKIDGASITSKTVNYGTTVKIDTGSKDYYHVKWTDNNSTSTSRSVKVTGNTTLTVKSVKNQLTISMYSNGGRLTPGNQQLCRKQAGCGKNECLDNHEINIPAEVAKCRNGSGLIYVGTPDNFDSTVYNTSGLRNYKNKTTATLYMTRSGCTATGYWHVGSATSSVKINENKKYANTKAFVQACGSNYDTNFKKKDITINLYAGWNCPNSITCAAGKYLPKNKTSCATCTAGNYCLGGTFNYSTTTDQGLSKCPNCYPSSSAGSSKINQCYVNVKANQYINNAKECPKTCPNHYHSSGQKVFYESTNNCTINQYKLNYNDDGGTGCSSKSITRNYNTAWGTLCKPTRTGYEFKGWYTGKNETGTKITNTSKATSNITVYANWYRTSTKARIYYLKYRSGNKESNCKKNNGAFDGSTEEGHPWRRYDYRSFQCYCEVNSKNKYTGKQTKVPKERNIHKGKIDYTMIVTYNNNAKGEKSCAWESGYYPNQNVSSVCFGNEFNYGSNDFAEYHGYIWYKNDTNKNDKFHRLEKAAGWYHNQGNYDKRYKPSGTVNPNNTDQQKAACNHACEVVEALNKL